ncbi:Cadherin-like protein 26 [Myotis brandtii]|uniref:Cadherin-like protein 26 n=1 Tax=Myotis brandtii TaxID=109478 RepID=S7QF09_MYOBR|nr:Cadherin-like protein 26 [Myotis brandtii]
MDAGRSWNKVPRWKNASGKRQSEPGGLPVPSRPKGSLLRVSPPAGEELGGSIFPEGKAERSPLRPGCPGASGNKLLLDFQSLRLMKEDSEDSASDLSDSERVPCPPSPRTPPDLRLRAEEIDPVCFDLDLQPGQGHARPEYCYPDFLPPPCNSWDLRDMALLANTEPRPAPAPRAGGLLGKYVDRLVQLEWLQILTVESHRPLRRYKRRWVVTTLELQEEDTGPFPKFVGELFNNMSVNMALMYLISGPGVDRYPEIGLFSIEDHENGKVYVHRPVDRETTPSFKVYFDVVNRLTGEYVDNSLIFNIRITDVNDHAPQFPENELNVSVRESHAAGVAQNMVGVGKAALAAGSSGGAAGTDGPQREWDRGGMVELLLTVDLDEENTPNSRVLYFLVSQKPLLKESGFEIDRDSGEIRLLGCLDYETAPRFTLLIRARDCGEPPLSATATVHISVQEGNNHRPTFIQENYKIQVPEGRVSPDVLRLPVQDDDSPFTSAWRAKFNISNGNEEGHFDISTDPETNEGILNVIKALDYETHPACSLVIAVENEELLVPCEAGELQKPRRETAASATVLVQVTDANNPPAFHPRSFVVSEVEGARPGTRLGRFNATDPDGSGSQIRYELAHDPASWVTVDERSGVVVTRQRLDRESPHVNNGVYVVIAHAVDEGHPPQTGTGTLTLLLSDINDNAPSLHPRSRYLEVCESSEPEPLLIEAEDGDLEPSSDPFTFELDTTQGHAGDTWKLGENRVALLLLLRCDCVSGAKRHRCPALHQEGQQTLITYNDESRAIAGQIGSEVRNQKPALPTHTAEEGAALGAKKLCGLHALAADPGSLPHIYMEEGELEGAESLSSLAFSEHTLSLPNLLDWLGPRPEETHPRASPKSARHYGPLN